MKRTLELNKQPLWTTFPTHEIDDVDMDGNFTGHKTKIYGTPVPINLNLYPSTGDITEQIFGKNITVDMIAVSSDVELNEDSIIFLSNPSDISKYDYFVTAIKRSKNVFNYGLRKRT